MTGQGPNGALPVLGVYGVPQQWPHIRALYQRRVPPHPAHRDRLPGSGRRPAPPCGAAGRAAADWHGTPVWGNRSRASPAANSAPAVPPSLRGASPRSHKPQN